MEIVLALSLALNAVLAWAWWTVRRLNEKLTRASIVRPGGSPRGRADEQEEVTRG